MKKFILFTLLSSLLPMIANADPVKIGNLWYNLNEENHTAEVCCSQDGTSYSGSIVIPQTVEGIYAVTSIGDDAFSGSEIETITIPSSITTIGGRAFDFCEKLERVDITDLAAWCRIVFIDYGAGNMDGQGHSNPLTYAGKLYLNGTRITGLIIPESITEIKDNAFRGGKFTSLTIPNTVTKIGEYAFEGCSTLRTAKVSNTESECYLTAIGHDAFYGCSALQSVNFTESVTELGEFAFAHCGALTEVKLNDNLTNILSNTFLECGSLTTINIPTNITSIGGAAFESCGNLSIDLELPEGLTTIGDRAFVNCGKLTTLSLPNTLTTIGDEAFAGASSLPSLYIPSSVTSIGSMAFVGLSNATSIIVDENNTKYNSREGCNALIETKSGKLLAGCRNTIIPDGILSLEKKALSGQPITFVILPNSVETIKENAFGWCDNLKTIVFGTGVTDIDRSIHYACVPNDIYCFATEVPMADGSAWNDVPLGWPRTLHVPAELIEEYQNTAPWDQIPSIVPITGDEHFGDIDVTIGATGYSTFSNGYTLDFTGVEGLAAYIAKGDKSLLNYETVGAVPAGTGLLLAGEEGTYQVHVIYSATDIDDNLLVGTGLKPSTTLEAGDYLLQNDPVDGIGFYRGEGKTLGAGKAYLHIDGGYDVKSFRLPDIPTSIHSIEAKQVNSVIYNLAGQRVQTPARGLYIVNGKKIAIK